MGRTSRGSRIPALLLLLLLLAAGALAVPRGTSPALDRAKAEAARALEKARTAAGRIPEGGTVPASAPAPESVAARQGRASQGQPDNPLGTPLRTVVRVVDGDTVVLDGNEKVRLIGINTPESVDPRRPVQWYGKEASAYTKGLLLGKRVRVEHDVEPRDRYGRTLAYLRLEDGTFVNLHLVEEGFASAYRYPPNVKFAEAFRMAERRAREARKGLWSDRAKGDSLVGKGKR